MSAPVPSSMSPPNVKLALPKDDPISLSQLKKYDGSSGAPGIYVAIKGTVFDVSAKSDVYGPGGSYAVFAGKDGSRGLAKSSLKPADAVADLSGLDDKETKVLNDWFEFFSKRYNIVGKVVP